MGNLLTYYELLGVPVNASTEEILKAYKEKSKEYHPDKNDGKKVSEVMFQYLGEAKDWLTDPSKRLEYDYIIGVKKRPDNNPPNNNRQQPTAKIGSTSTSYMIGIGVIGVIVGVAIASLFGDKK
jgi:curved DNA-binding protein CbpA